MATAKRSTTWACVTSMAEAPPGTLARYCILSLSPGLSAVLHCSEVTSRSERWAGLGQSSASLSQPREKKQQLLTSRNLDSKGVGDLVFLLCSCILRT